MKRAFWILVVAIVATNCEYDVAEELYPPNGCNTDNVSYSQDIVPIIDTNCYRCHSEENSGLGAGIVLEGYDKIEGIATNGTLLGVIRHEGGFTAMPLDASKIDDCSINKIEAWIADGAQDN